MGRREQFTVGELLVTDKIVMGQAAYQPEELKTNMKNLTYLSCGAPALEVANRLVTTANMKVGSYTVANSGLHSGSECRSVRLTVTKAGNVDTLGTITITGTDYLDQVITDIIVPIDNTTADGVKCFKTVTSIVGAGWVSDGTPDTIVIGTGPLVQIPAYLAATADVVFAIFTTAIINAPTVTISSSVISLNTINASSLTYDGTKKLRVLCDLS